MKEGFNMKRKFLSIVSLFLAVMMILPMGVFVYADGEGGGEGGTPVTEALKIYCDEKDVSGTSFEKYIPLDTTLTLTAKGGDGKYNWYSNKSSIVEVSGSSNTITVSPKTEGEVTIFVNDESNNVAQVTITFIRNNCTSIEVEKYNKNYISGQSFDVSSLVVKGHYQDLTVKPINNSDLTIEPAGALKASDRTVTIKYGQLSTTVDVEVSEKKITSVNIVNPQKNFTEGDALPSFEVEVTYDYGDPITLIDGYDVYINGSKVDSNYKLKTTDTSVKVSFGGVESRELGIKVSPEVQ